MATVRNNEEKTMVVDNELGGQLHDRAPRGEELSKEDQMLLDTWYEAQDRAEMKGLNLTATDEAKTIKFQKDMKKEYDFSKGERGKFYHPEAQLNLPVYLEPDVAEFIQRHSTEKNTDIQTLVNQWLRKDIEVLKLIM